MNPCFLLPLLSAVACLVFGVLILARGPDATENRCAAWLLLGGAWWGLCEAVWTLAPDAATALFWLRVSAPGWILVGPVCLHLFLTPRSDDLAPLRRALPFAYATAGCFLALEWLDPWLPGGPLMTLGMEPVAWGWAYRPGPACRVWYAFTVVAASAGAIVAALDLRREVSPAEAQQSPWLGMSVGIPLLVGSTTDGLLPNLGVEAPRLGVASFAAFGAVVAWSMHRFGFSLLAPSALAEPILDSIPDGVALATLDGRIRLANPGLAQLLGEPLGSLHDRRVQDFLPDVVLTRDIALRELECELLGGDAERIPVALSAAPLRDRRGGWIGLVLVVRDLREVVSLRGRLLTSARLAAVGELAAGIAHEINNPLAYIGTNLRALREQWESLADAWRSGAAKQQLIECFDEGASMLDDALEGVERTAAIVRDVRDLSRGADQQREVCDANDLLERTLRIAAPQLGGAIRVDFERGEIGLLEAARRELEQVFLNLIVNAAQAIETTGTIRIRTRSGAGEIEIAIEDDGAGIGPAVLERIFDPFFTTKPVGQGTGLGLAISHEIVRRHGGRIEVSSEPGSGTTFRVSLPAATA